MESTPPSKRARYNAETEAVDQWLVNNNFDADEFWKSAALYSVAEDTHSGGNIAIGGKRRNRDITDQEDFNVNFSDFLNDGFLYNDIQGPDLLAQLFPELEPTVPLPEDRIVSLAVPNPFAVEGTLEHPRIRSKVAPLVLPVDGAVNGLIKFRLRAADRQHAWSRPQGRLFLRRGSSTESSEEQSQSGGPGFQPPDFGRDLHLDAEDYKLWNFYLIAFCPGRTLLPQTNVWENGLPSIAQKSDCVKFALLSLAAGYVLDYAPSEKLKEKANKYHRKAVALLGLELNKSENYEPGKEEPLLASIALLNQIDMINWETHLGYGGEPQWYRGLKALKHLLDKSDPGYRYQKPGNVQSSFMRYFMSNVQAQNEIFCQVASPLDLRQEECPYPWLLEGSYKEVRRIIGPTGLSPKLLHVFAQITHLTAELVKNNDSLVIQVAGKAILERLRKLRQWSDFSEGYTSADALFKSQVLDISGKLCHAAHVVDFTAHGYLVSAELYLHCRLLRKPRRHPDVQMKLQELLDCTKNIPLSGHLYTAQVSLLGPVIAAIVAVREEDRAYLKHHFTFLLDGPRGNVPPCWRMVQDLWEWMDNDLLESNINDELPLAQRPAWWEEVVTRIREKEGRLSLI